MSTQNLTTSSSMLAKIKAFEGGFRAKAYRDGSTNGTPQFSIGYGHQIQPNEAYLKTATITQATALNLLMGNITPLELQINRANTGFNQNQFDACINFGFNEGSGALAKILQTWSNTHSTVAVTNEMSQYNKTHDNVTNALVVSADLTAREKYNVDLFNTKPSLIPSSALLAGAGVLAAVAAMAMFRS